MSNATPVENAVSSLKADAQKRAEEYARKIIAHIEAELSAAGWDINKAAPFPNSLKCNRAEYVSQKAKYQMFHSVTTSRPGQFSIQKNAANLVDMNPERVAKFVAEAREDAAAQYTAFVAKLVKKIGVHTTAELNGNHVWGHSILTVTTPTGVQKWKTQTIINTSKLGKVFNQYPTRLVK